MLLGFKPQFEPAIRSKRKRHTIRARRKIRPRVGEICHCYVGLRKKGARLLGRWPCVKVQNISITADRRGCVFIRIDGALPLTWEEANLFAQSDGFADLIEMMKFWEGRLPFAGDIIHWDPDKPAALSNTSTSTKARANKKKTP